MRGFGGALAVLALWLPAAVRAAPACAPGLVPDYAAPGTPPNRLVWEKKAVPHAELSECAGWGDWKPSTVAALAGTFRFDGTADDLLARFGAISTLTTVKYWSVTDRRWNQLITEAAALKGTDGWERRADFTAAELKAGDALHFIQFDNRSTGGTVYRMRATEVSADALRVTVENASAVSFLFVTAYEPGDMRSVHVLERAGPGLWRYFGLAGLRGGGLTGIGRASTVNRAVAMYRHLAGIPTDREPPAMRE